MFTTFFTGVDEQGYADGQILVSSNTYEQIENWSLFFDDGDDDGLCAAGCEIVQDEEAPDNPLIFIPAPEDESVAVVAEWEGQGISVTI